MTKTKPYTLERSALDTITKPEQAFGCTRLLPDYDQVPEEFKQGNAYTRLVSCMFSGDPVPDGEVIFRPGFTDPDAAKALLNAVQAHLRSFSPKHEHKIAGVAYMISQACELKEAQVR